MKLHTIGHAASPPRFMLQRIQTLYLLFAIAGIAGFLFTPVIRYEATDIDFVKNVPAWNVKPFVSGYYIFIVAIFEGIAISLSLIAIFLFKKRQLQMGLCWMALFFHLAAVAYIFYFFQTKETPIDIVYTAWNLAAIPTVVFIVLAYINIKKDDELVKSMDRLRD